MAKTSTDEHYHTVVTLQGCQVILTIFPKPLPLTGQSAEAATGIFTGLRDCSLTWQRSLK